MDPYCGAMCLYYKSCISCRKLCALCYDENYNIDKGKAIPVTGHGGP
jgi:hypothetical protein